jgi:two-component system cell cycle response regulator
LMLDDTMEQMIDRADQSLLVAKKSGRNRVVHYSATTASGESALQQAGGRGNVFQGILASQVMNAPVASLPADATVGEAAEFFLQFRVNSAPVIDLEGKLIGILSEKDVLGILFSQDAWSTPIAKIMQRNVVCYEEGADVQSICEFLGRVAIRRVVIVRDGRPTGVVSRGSLLRWYANAMTASDGADPAVTLHRQDESTRLRLIESAQAVANCASQLAESISGPVDDLAVPVIEGLSKLQELVNSFLTGSVGREPRASVADTLMASLESSANSAMVATP